ncbi:hypothetical protein PF002_g3763 [Phytophthora fragariae]|uniref:Uncharacterized protein n=3 Tax=Phytophthora fragariae TaxID=53985 RepID=A0A6A3U109_9STRA|nr:hypothetical protein PF006_g10237 [Phytophthora fragariae]KAE9232732.1 hypothetical protein PF004_g9858 [Phytophthora fragariae]KAE9252556.1 hypothetical protein PF002_g3763 [Phytophthora fragariae]KAE9310224.1 hypothetical protein PF001_g10286 [Phytophthora fragariae]
MLDVEATLRATCFRMKEGSGIMAPARVGKVTRFVKPNASSRMPEHVNGLFATQSEVAVVEPVKVKVFAEIADVDFIPATKWDAAAHATGEVFEPRTSRTRHKKASSAGARNWTSRGRNSRPRLLIGCVN